MIATPIRTNPQPTDSDMTKNKADYKEMIAYAMAETGPYGFLGMSECERYGMTWGCDEDCPVYRRGECKNEVTLAQLGDNRKCKGYDKERV